MREMRVYVGKNPAGILQETEKNKTYKFIYADNYAGRPVSLTMPITKKVYEYTGFPPFFDGLLPEGIQLDSLLRISKLDRNDLFGQLLVVGRDLVGDVSVGPL
jgi:serine/threonine-protein kinase HipA